jgi:ABC-2 family transporter protein
MTWLLWRQHRSQALVVAIALGVFAVLTLITGVRMADSYAQALKRCTEGTGCAFTGNLFNGDGAIIDLERLTLVVPVLLGAFLGATLIARETESATNVLVWTQSVTRRRWLYGKVATIVLAAVAVSAAVSALVTWWSGTLNSLDGNRFQGAQFDTQNILPVAFTLFAVALGIAAGALFRRTLPALATTIGIYVAVRLAVGVYLRPHFGALVTRSFPVGRDPRLPSGSWTVSSDLVDRAGHSVSGAVRAPASCGSVSNRAASDRCLARIGFHQVVKYHPAGQYWHFQVSEAAIFVGLAAALLAVGLVVTLRRDA